MVLTPRSLFNIVLKIFGLFFLREIINQITTTVTVFISYFSIDEYETTMSMLIVSLLVLFFYIFLVLQLLFRTNKIIDVLRLDIGFLETEFTFDEKSDKKINLTTSEILMISLTILGGYMLVQEIPNLCKQIYVFAQERKSIFYGSPAPSGANMLTPFSKILIGLLILGERRRIIDFIESKTRKENEEEI